MTIKYFIIMMYSFLVINLTECSNNPSANKITVIGTAIVIKHHAAVKTDDSLLYYLHGVDDWDEKYKGKRVKVTGKFMKLPPPVTKNPNPRITASVQPRVRDGEYIKYAKWRLAK